MLPQAVLIEDAYENHHASAASALAAYAPAAAKSDLEHGRPAAVPRAARRDRRRDPVWLGPCSQTATRLRLACRRGRGWHGHAGVALAKPLRRAARAP